VSVEVALLGPVELRLDGNPAALAGAPQRVVLARLALAAGRVLADGIGNPMVRSNYAASTALCTPGSLSQPGAYGLGTQGGPAKRLALLAEAGFENPVVAADTGVNLVLAATRGVR
jgi:hypothetical protein